MQSSTIHEVLRPLTVGQILDRSIRVYRNNFATFTGIIALILVPVTLIQFVGTVIQFPAMQAMNSADTSSEASTLALSAAMLSLLFSLLYFVLYLALVEGLARPALARAIADSYLGEKVGAFEAYGRIVSSWPRLLVAMLVMSLLALVLLVLSVIVCLVPGMLMYFSVIIWQLVGPIIVLEKRDVMAALRRAWDLTRRRFWWVLGFMLILFVFTFLLVIGPSYAVTFLTNTVILDVLPSDDPNMIYAAQSAIQTLTQLLFSLITMPLQTTAIVLMYFDLRVRTEGLDLAILSAEGEAPTSPEGMIAEAPPPEQGNLVTGTELLYFVGVSLSSAMLCFAFYAVIITIMMAMISAVGF